MESRWLQGSIAPSHPPRGASTLLGDILGQVGRWLVTGELRELWRRSVTARTCCGYGELAASCPVWSEVRRRRRVFDLDQAPEPVIAAGDAGSSDLDHAPEQVIADQCRAGTTPARVRADQEVRRPVPHLTLDRPVGPGRRDRA